MSRKVRRWTGTVVVSGRGVYGLDWFCADSKELAEHHLMHCYGAEGRTPDPKARPRVRMLDWVYEEGPSPEGGGKEWVMPF
jgi:hypothetical protein